MRGCVLGAAVLLACSGAESTLDVSEGAAEASAEQALGGDALSTAQFLFHTYQVVLNRAPDAPGFDSWMAATTDRRAAFAGFLASGEFRNNPSLNNNKPEYVRRLYRMLLEREPAASEVNGWVAALKNADGTGAQALAWYDAFVGFVDSAEYGSRGRPIAGVHFAIPINPTVALTDADVVAHAYRVLLGRAHDVGGFKTWFGMLQRGQLTRAGLFAGLTGSPEFLSNPTLRDRRSYVIRLYQVLLLRTPSAPEVDGQLALLKEHTGAGPGSQTWFQMFEGFVGSSEFKAKNCHRGYFTYDQQLPRSALLLKDLMRNTARMQTVSESEIVQLRFAAGGVTAVWDQKLPLVKEPSTGLNFGITRGYHAPTDSFDLYLMREQSPGSAVFDQVGGPLFGAGNYYDAQLAVDNAVCPRRYVMTMECNGSLCLSHSTMPTKGETWTAPARAVSACSGGSSCGGRYRSASTGVALFDHRKAYLSWTEVDDGYVWPYVPNGPMRPDEGFEATHTSAIAHQNLYAPSPVSVGNFPNPYLLRAQNDVRCTSAWDCNNQDAQDWKAEGPYFYLAYNGANYYRCVRPPQDSGLTSDWGLSFARARSPLGPYSERLARSQVVMAQRHDTCGISYPTVNVVNQQLYVYFAHYEPAGGNKTRRVRLVPR